MNICEQVDIAGEWAARVQEDQPHRVPGAELGDYTGLPINAAARQKANVWDASILSAPEEVPKPHAPHASNTSSYWCCSGWPRSPGGRPPTGWPAWTPDLAPSWVRSAGSWASGW